MNEVSDRVFLVRCEVRGKKLRQNGYVGGFVTCFVAKDHIEDAVAAAREALDADGYEIADIDEVVLFQQDDWTESAEYADLAALAVASKELQYSDFDVWGH